MKHGVEQEIQVVNSEGHLVYKADEILKKLPDRYQDFGKGGIYKDVYDSQLEIATDVCDSLEELKDQLLELRDVINRVAHQADLFLISTGANAFTKGKVGEYFAEQHHIDAKDKKDKLKLNNLFRIFVPEIFALSSNSPVHDNSITRWKSTRASMDTYDPSKRVNPNIKPAPYLYSEDIERGYLLDFSEEESFEKKRKKSRYYDISPFTQKDRITGEYKPTLEIRLLDTHHSVPLTIAYGALFQALAKKAERMNHIPSLDISHNRSEAIKNGMDSKFIYKRREKRFYHYTDLSEFSAKAVLNSLFKWLDPEIKELGFKKFIKPLKRLIRSDRNLADWQINVFTRRREEYSAEMIGATMENFDDPPIKSKLNFKVIDQEEGRKSIEMEEDIKKSYKKLKKALRRPYFTDFRTLANCLLAIAEVDPNLEDDEVDRYIDSMLLTKYSNSNFYYDLLLIDTLFAYGRTSMDIYRRKSEELTDKISEGMIGDEQLWLSAYALTVISRVGGEDIDKESLAQKLKERIEKDSPPWVIAYAVESYANCGLDYDDELDYLKNCLKEGFWECEQTDKITTTSLVYNCLKEIGYTNDMVVKYIKENLKAQNIINREDMLKIARLLRAVSDEVIK